MKRLFGGILQAVGALIAGLSGLCSFFSLIGAMSNLSNGGIMGLGMVLLFGGPPLAIGLALFAWGKSILRDLEEDG